MSMIQVQNLHKTYGKKANAYEALRGINLSIQKGQSIAIIGKSGSGKSTLMHLMAGLDTPTTGDVLFQNNSLNKLNERELAQLRNKKFGFIFQQFFLQPGMSVLENVALPLKIQGIGSDERTKIARQMLTEVELLDKENNKAADLSGGQKQRAAIARALVTTPEVIFADEPTGNLDVETGDKIMELLFKLQNEKGITIVIVTHDPDIASKCNITISIKDGKLQN